MALWEIYVFLTISQCILVTSICWSAGHADGRKIVHCTEPRLSANDAAFGDNWSESHSQTCVCLRTDLFSQNGICEENFHPTHYGSFPETNEKKEGTAKLKVSAELRKWCLQWNLPSSMDMDTCVHDLRETFLRLSEHMYTSCVHVHVCHVC